MITNETKIGKVFGPEIIKHIKGSDYIEIATGYFAYEELNRLTPSLLKVASRGSCKLLFGMVFHERATRNQKRRPKKTKGTNLGRNGITRTPTRKLKPMQRNKQKPPTVRVWIF